jgi:beta-galactosidase
MKFLYGGDYNPEQWMHSPETLDKDIELMKEAGCNVMSIGIFGWSVMEPREGEYDLSFYESIINRLYENGIYTILATPSAAMPAWMSKKYPEILRTDENGAKHKHGVRQNHCFTSPIYRRKVREMNEQLALTFKDNPAIYAIHVSNEYYTDCQCELCAQAFREFLKKRYNNDLEKLNFEWWNSFWSHTYTDWDEIEPPSTIGENSSKALMLNWRRFVTYQTIDFYKNEIEPFRRLAPNIPITTNSHTKGIDNYKFAEYTDFTCWDAYPRWHATESEFKIAAEASFIYDSCRSMKHKPFLLMESTPSCVNWQEYNKLKRPGMNKLSSLQAIANGADSVQYFQWRKSRGSAEKFHGAVVDHCGHGNTRVFREAAEIGEQLDKISQIQGSDVKSEAAVIYDYENRWAIIEAEGFQRNDKKYDEECLKQYSYFLKNGINTDIIDSRGDFSRYKMIVAPMLYMVKEGVAERLCEFVRNGGILVSGFMSGYVDDDDLCYLGGFPGGKLKELFGIWNEEIDTLYPEDRNSVTFGGEKYEAFDYCEIIHPDTAEVLAEYNEDFYAQSPAVTVNNYGQGKAYYIAFRGEEKFIDDFFASIDADIYSSKEKIDFPEGVTVRTRENESNEYFFVQNWNENSVNVNLKTEFENLNTGKTINGEVKLEKYETLILKK